MNDILRISIYWCSYHPVSKYQAKNSKKRDRIFSKNVKSVRFSITILEDR